QSAAHTPSKSLPLNNWQNQVRGIGLIMMNAINGRHKILCLLSGDRATGMRVAIKTWKVAAGDLQANTMAREKDIRGRPQIDAQFIDAPRLHQNRLCEGFAITGAKNPIGEQFGTSIGMNINQFAGKIGIAGG